MAHQPSECSFGRRGKRRAADLLRGQAAGRDQSGRRRFHITLDPGDLTGKPKMRSEPQAEGVIEARRKSIRLLNAERLTEISEA